MDIIDVIREQEADDAFLLGEEFGDMESQNWFVQHPEVTRYILAHETNSIPAISIPMEDPIIHTAVTGYYCSSLSNPEWATCPCRVAMEEQDMSEDEAGAHPPDCSCYWCSAGEE